MSKYQLPEIQELYAVKTLREIGYITRAQQIAEVVLTSVIKKIRVGISEVALVRFIVAQLKKHGVKALAFEPIVAFGKGSADIHHWATRTRLEKNQIVMFDFGATWQGYCSDMSRTFFFGKPNAKFQRVYQAVLTAQERSLRLLQSGERHADKIDSTARSFLNKKFGAKCFLHGLGHGIGTAIHEWPSLKPKSTDVLKSGMVVTLEPGVYLKGWGGVRIEDMVLITVQGAYNLTKAPKDLSGILLRP